jgi:hypothetical protein
MIEIDAVQQRDDQINTKVEFCLKNTFSYDNYVRKTFVQSFFLSPILSKIALF